jgi:hypothetical protein
MLTSEEGYENVGQYVPIYSDVVNRPSLTLTVVKPGIIQLGDDQFHEDLCAECVFGYCNHSCLKGYYGQSTDGAIVIFSPGSDHYYVLKTKLAVENKIEICRRKLEYGNCFESFLCRACTGVFSSLSVYADHLYLEKERLSTISKMLFDTQKPTQFADVSSVLYMPIFRYGDIRDVGGQDSLGVEV